MAASREREAEAPNELARVLMRRRRQVEQCGSQFEKDPLVSARKADARSEEQTAGQHRASLGPGPVEAVSSVCVEAHAAAVATPQVTTAAPDVVARCRPAVPTLKLGGDAVSEPPAADPEIAVAAVSSTSRPSPQVRRLLSSGFALTGSQSTLEAADALTATVSMPVPTSPSSASTKSTASVHSSAPVPAVPMIFQATLLDAAVDTLEATQPVPSLESSRGVLDAMQGPPLLSLGGASAPVDSGAGCSVAPCPTMALNPCSGAGLAVDPAIWHAIVEGDLLRIEDLHARGSLSSGRLRDCNNHSVFWNAVAFQHAEVALWLLRHFPEDSGSTGVDLTEVHARRGDSLLHLCLYFADFTAPAAELFRALFHGAPRMLANQNGQNLYHIAAARLNFWVLQFALTNAPDSATLLLDAKDSSTRTALDILLSRAQEVTAGLPGRPVPVLPSVEARLRMWSPLSQYVPQGLEQDGRAPDSPPFADLVVEVEDSSVEGGVARLLAHRVVLSACSGALHRQLQQLAPGAPLQVDPLCCRSSVVVALVLAFLYLGELPACSFAEDAFLLWQLLCLCTQYALPRPLTTYARTALLHALGEPRYQPVVPVLLEAADMVSLSLEETCFTACVLLRNAQAEDVEHLLMALSAVERYVMAGAGHAAQLSQRPHTSTPESMLASALVQNPAAAALRARAVVAVPASRPGSRALHSFEQHRHQQQFQALCQQRSHLGGTLLTSRPVLAAPLLQAEPIKEVRSWFDTAFAV